MLNEWFCFKFECAGDISDVMCGVDGRRGVMEM